MAFGAGRYTYEVEVGWGRLPDGWSFGWIPAVACDSKDNVYVYSRSEHPLVIFDRDGNFLDSWGDDILEDAHGIYIDSEDNVWCTERETHCVRKFNKDGELVMTIGTPGQQGANDGDPFRLPTDLVVASTGELFVSDGYGNARVHKYSAEGELLYSWGSWGSGKSQFELSHCIRQDKNDRLWVCDRTNNRIEIFDTDGNYLEERGGLKHPDTIYFDPTDDVVYVAELDQQVSIYTLNGELLSQWGGAAPSDKPGEFKACPHGIWADSRGDLYVGQVQADDQLQKFVRI
ncbi:peptidyl-alpha-hydroxyglycine alpha-amidating lyase family protein [Chloroflexi bacterium TSY]|nr:peptidyl-alpha-hydroxyglycine alpha-amidating lyase family protein [Chloroflexi bacterium TSY]